MIQIRIFFSFYIVFHYGDTILSLQFFPIFSSHFFPSKIENHPQRVVQLVAWCKAATSCETPLRCHGHSSIWKPSYAAKRHRVWRGFRGDGDGWGRGEVCSGRIRGRNQPYMVLLVTSAQCCKFPRSKDIPKNSIERFSEQFDGSLAVIGSENTWNCIFYILVGQKLHRSVQALEEALQGQMEASGAKGPNYFTSLIPLKTIHGI